jgi:hypothetical protein
MLPLTVVCLAVVMLVVQPRPPMVQSIELTVPNASLTLQSRGSHLVHELHITNFQQTDVSIRAVAVFDDSGRELARYEGPELARRMTRPGFRNDHATPHVIGAGMRAVVNFWIELPGTTPFVHTLTHTVDAELTRAGKAVPTTVTRRFARILNVLQVEIDAPLRGGPWIAIYDPLLKGGHRTAVYTLEGVARIPGRFAIDFIAHPESGVLPSKRAADSNGFGAEVLAVADGTIAIAVDGVADATPQPISLELAPGNHIALDLGNGRYAFYEHLQMNSVRVKAGDRVTRGQVIARLGSSGSSSIGPHLHFHLADAPSPLAAEGVPFVFRQFAEIGRFASLTSLLSGEKWLPAASAATMQRHRPGAVTVIHFP